MHQPVNAASSAIENVLAALRRLRFAAAQSKIDWQAVRHLEVQFTEKPYGPPKMPGKTHKYSSSLTRLSRWLPRWSFYLEMMRQDPACSRRLILLSRYSRKPSENESRGDAAAPAAASCCHYSLPFR